MLELLHIENIAVIESADISFRTFQAFQRILLGFFISQYTIGIFAVFHPFFLKILYMIQGQFLQIVE